MSYRALFDLKGRAAVVTGGAGFLGRRFCAGLAEFGAAVAVADANAGAARELAARLQRAYGVRTLGIGCDVSDASSVRKMFRAVSGALGPLRILLNNAAAKPVDRSAFFAGVETYSPKEWRRVMSVNLDGMFYAAQAFGKHVLSHGRGGSIIQTASIYGFMAPDQRVYEGLTKGERINAPAVYSAAKGGVIALTKYLAAYWGDKGIRVNTLSPGGVENAQGASFRRKYSARVPMRRMAHPDELVGALIYLASDASNYVTGQNLAVDGGLSAW